MSNSYQPEKKYSKIGVKLIFFTFFVNFLVETLIKSIIHCQTMTLARLLMYIVKIVCQASLCLRS